MTERQVELVALASQVVANRRARPLISRSHRRTPSENSKANPHALLRSPVAHVANTPQRTRDVASWRGAIR